MPPILRERPIGWNITQITNTVKITAWGDGMYLGRNKYSGWTVEKEPICDLEKFIERYAHTAGDEANLCMKAPQRENEAQQPTATADPFNPQS